MRFLIGVLLLAASAFGLAQNTLNLEFSSEGPREIWVHPIALPTPTQERLSATGTSIEVPLEGVEIDSSAISVRDVGTGMVAMRPLKGLKSPWKLVTSDYNRLYQLDVELQHKGQPVAYAVVKLQAEKEQRQEILDSQSRGIVSFYNIPKGPYRIVADVKSEGQTVSTPAQTFNPQPEDGVAPKLTISVNPVVEVIGAAPVRPVEAGGNAPESPDGGAEDKPRGEPGMGIVGTLIGMVLGLALLAGIGYGIYRYLQVKGTETEAQLAKLGLGGSHPPADPAPAVPSAPAPIQKIVLGDADPTPLSAAAAAPLSAGAVANPRLVRENGDVVLLPEGRSEVGREAAIAIPGESSVSRRHAAFERQGAVVTVADLGSTNGTWVNGRRIDAPTPVNSGDQVLIGSIKFRFEV